MMACPTTRQNLENDVAIMIAPTLYNTTVHIIIFQRPNLSFNHPAMAAPMAAPPTNILMISSCHNI